MLTSAFQLAQVKDSIKICHFLYVFRVRINAYNAQVEPSAHFAQITII